MFSIEKYTPLFPTTQVACAILFYFNWVRLTMAHFSGRPILLTLVLVGHLLLLFLMRYYPSFKQPSSIQKEEFFFAGQGYFEAAVVGTLGYGLNWAPCPPVIKYTVFLAALPAIHFLCTKRIKSEASGVLHYPDVSRPLNPDE